MAVIDSEAAMSIITHSLMRKLGYTLNKLSNLVIITANGAHIKAFEEISHSQISCNYLKIPINIQVIESKDDVLILGNDWLTKSVHQWIMKEIPWPLNTKKGANALRSHAYKRTLSITYYPR